MLYRMLSEFEFSSLKRGSEKDVRDVSNLFNGINLFVRNATSIIRELNSSQASLSRAVDERVRELQRNTGRSSGYSSSYSSSDSKIRESNRNIERCISQLSSAVSQIVHLCDVARRSETDFENKFSVLMDAYLNLVRQLNEANKECERTRQKLKEADRQNGDLRANLENLTREKNDADRRSFAKEQKMRSEIKEANRKAAMIGTVAVAEAVSAMQSQNEFAARKLEAERRDCERQVLALKQAYEQEISTLKETIKQNSVKDSLTDSGLEDSVERESIDEVNIYADEYAALWNKILDDNIVEISEVQEIRNWIECNSCDVPEFMELSALCDSILARKAVVPDDVQSLYDCSFRFLKALGVRVDEETTKATKDGMRRKPFRFSMCGIESGEEIVFINDENNKAIVIDDRHVSFSNETMSLSALAKKLLGCKHPVQGTQYFKYNGRVLDDIRKEREEI